MSYLIRSANGQRSLTKINSNKTQDQQDRPPIRDDIIEALKGIVIKFELRIADIIEESTEEQNDDEKQSPETIKATFAVKKDNIISDLKTKLVINDQLVPEPKAEVVGAPVIATINKENGTKKENGFAGFKPAVLDLPRPQSSATMQIPKRVSDIRPVTSRPAQVVQAPVVQDSVPVIQDLAPAVQNPGPVVQDPVAQAPAPVVQAQAPVVQDPAPAVQAPAPVVQAPAAARIAPVVQAPIPVVQAAAPVVQAPTSAALAEPLKPTVQQSKLVASEPKTELVKGTLKIGSIIETCVVGFGGSEDEPIYYIPYDTDKFIYINQLIQDQGPTIESQAMVNSINVGDIVFGKSKEDNSWYRSIVKKVNVEDVEVFFIDWGLEETLENARIRHLAMPVLGLSGAPAAAVKIDVINKPGPLVDRFVRDGERLNVRVESYDRTTETYSIDIMDDQ